MKLTLGYLYHEYMNIYGDTGNLITLQKRCKWRGIEFEIIPLTLHTWINPNVVDIYFFGGGQDEQQEFIATDFPRFAELIHQDIDNGAVALTICGGYQLFGDFYRPFDKPDLPGISLFHIETHASNTRMIGNCIVELDPTIQQEMQNIYAQPTQVPNTLVGFENHSGQTKPNSTYTSYLGTVRHGYGNNEHDKQEGFRYKNAFGTYLHGSLLPKNPHFADLLIAKALEHRTKEPIKLQPLDDTLAYQAHQQILQKYR